MSAEHDGTIGSPVASSSATAVAQAPRPAGGVDHRCPLGCPIDSNPLALDARDDELDTETWRACSSEAARARRPAVPPCGRRGRVRGANLVDITAAAHCRGHYTISSLGRRHHGEDAGSARAAGLDHVQDLDPGQRSRSADHIAGYAGGVCEKAGACGRGRAAGVATDVNAVMHTRQYRSYREMVDLAAWRWARSARGSPHVQY